MFEVNRDRLINNFIELVKISSPSWHEQRLIDYITNEFQGLNVDYESHKCGDSYNILAKVDGNKSGDPILFSCHLDTVLPCENINPVVSATKISSDGTSILGADDKAAIASFLEALYYLKENNISHRPVEFLFTCAEEVGLYGIKGFDISLLKSKIAFVFDSAGEIGRIVLKAPYHISMDVTVNGKAAHAGIMPECGISAIRALAEMITKIPHGRIDKETTANVGIISGGKATNIVAEEAGCKLEIRSISYKKLKATEIEIKNVINNVSKSYRAKTQIKINMEYSGFSIDQSEKIIKIIEKALGKIRIKPKFEVSGGGSDTNVINKAGIKAVNLSIGMMNVHTKNEFIYIKDLVDGARLVLSIIDSV